MADGMIAGITTVEEGVDPAKDPVKDPVVDPAKGPAVEPLADPGAPAKDPEKDPEDPEKDPEKLTKEEQRLKDLEDSEDTEKDPEPTELKKQNSDKDKYIYQLQKENKRLSEKSLESREVGNAEKDVTTILDAMKAEANDIMEKCHQKGDFAGATNAAIEYREKKAAVIKEVTNRRSNELMNDVFEADEKKDDADKEFRGVVKYKEDIMKEIKKSTPLTTLNRIPKETVKLHYDAAIGRDYMAVMKKKSDVKRLKAAGTAGKGALDTSKSQAKTDDPITEIFKSVSPNGEFG